MQCRRKRSLYSFEQESFSELAQKGKGAGQRMLVMDAVKSGAYLWEGALCHALLFSKKELLFSKKEQN